MLLVTCTILLSVLDIGMQIQRRVNVLKERLARHLRYIEMSYIEHLIRAMRFSMLLFLASIVCLIHSIIPFVLEKSASSIIKKLYREM
jgi:hypothetical protein